jgi:hypothetical protein
MWVLELGDFDMLLSAITQFSVKRGVVIYGFLLVYIFNQVHETRQKRIS